MKRKIEFKDGKWTWPSHHAVKFWYSTHHSSQVFLFVQWHLSSIDPCCITTEADRTICCIHPYCRQDKQGVSSCNCQGRTCDFLLLFITICPCNRIIHLILKHHCWIHHTILDATKIPNSIHAWLGWSCVFVFIRIMTTFPTFSWQHWRVAKKETPASKKGKKCSHDTDEDYKNKIRQTWYEQYNASDTMWRVHIR